MLKKDERSSTGMGVGGITATPGPTYAYALLGEGGGEAAFPFSFLSRASCKACRARRWRREQCAREYMNMRPHSPPPCRRAPTNRFLSLCSNLHSSLGLSLVPPRRGLSTKHPSLRRPLPSSGCGDSEQWRSMAGEVPLISISPPTTPPRESPPSVRQAAQRAADAALEATGSPRPHTSPTQETADKSNLCHDIVTIATTEFTRSAAETANPPSWVSQGLFLSFSFSDAPSVLFHIPIHSP